MEDLPNGYTTVSEALNDLKKRGYTRDFNLHPEEECIICAETHEQLSPDHFLIDAMYRFEGDTDPGDEAIVYAIASDDYEVKGVLVNAYGIYADPTAAKTIKRLKLRE